MGQETRKFELLGVAFKVGVFRLSDTILVKRLDITSHTNDKVITNRKLGDDLFGGSITQHNELVPILNRGLIPRNDSRKSIIRQLGSRR